MVRAEKVNPAVAEMDNPAVGNKVNPAVAEMDNQAVAVMAVIQQIMGTMQINQMKIAILVNPVSS